MSNAAVTEWTALLRVLASAALGGIVGWDRESRHRSSAGIRTHMMVGAGACLFAKSWIPRNMKKCDNESLHTT